MSDKSENVTGFLDQLRLLQDDIVMIRVLVRKDYKAAVDHVHQVKKRIDYMVEEY